MYKINVRENFLIIALTLIISSHLFDANVLDRKGNEKNEELFIYMQISQQETVVSFSLA